MPPIYVWEDFHRRIRNKQTPQDNNAMHAKPDLRVVLKWMINRSGSVIADVIRVNQMAISFVVRTPYEVPNGRFIKRFRDDTVLDWLRRVWNTTHDSTALLGGSFYGGFAHLLDARHERSLPCLLYTSPSPRDQRGSRMPSSA